MIYYVEDDANIRELVVYTLEQTGFAARGFANAAAFFQACEDRLPELALLDIMLPGEDGMAILARLRGTPRTKNLPVIMVTARGSEYDKVSGLDSGADDYIAKPFSMTELVSRIRALLRRTASEESDSAKLELGALTLDSKRRAVLVANAPVALTYKEFELLRHLMEHRGIALSRERLLETVWGYDYDGGTRTVDVHIRTLRKKLGPCGALIQTVRGIGYRIMEAEHD